jgi:two-component system nitrate/nitrite response regulator NarL
METVKVLVIVEDEPDMRMLIKTVLATDPRLEVLGEATNAADAIRLAGELGPGLVILDHSIEGPVTGLQAAPAIRAAAPSAKILLFTAYDMASEARREPAVDAFLRKDDIGKLLRTVQSLLELTSIG